MPIPLFNSIASWILKKRIHQIELFVRYPIEVQNELLHNLVKTAAQTEIGKKYDLVVDIQGDEPLISPTHIDKVVSEHSKTIDADILLPTLSTKIKNNTNIVRVVSDINSFVLYF